MQKPVATLELCFHSLTCRIPFDERATFTNFSPNLKTSQWECTDGSLQTTKIGLDFSYLLFKSSFAEYSWRLSKSFSTGSQARKSEELTAVEHKVGYHPNGNFLRQDLSIRKLQKNGFPTDRGKSLKKGCPFWRRAHCIHISITNATWSKSISTHSVRSYKNTDKNPLLHLFAKLKAAKINEFV